MGLEDLRGGLQIFAVRSSRGPEHRRRGLGDLRGGEDLREGVDDGRGVLKIFAGS